MQDKDLASSINRCNYHLMHSIPSSGDGAELALHGSSLRIQNLTVAIDGKTVLDDIDFALASGSYLVVLGPSGSGKTTLLRTIAGLLDPANGSIIVDGQDVTALRRGKGMLHLFSRYLGFSPSHRRGEHSSRSRAESRSSTGGCQERGVAAS